MNSKAEWPSSRRPKRLDWQQARRSGFAPAFIDHSGALRKAGLLEVHFVGGDS